MTLSIIRPYNDQSAVFLTRVNSSYQIVFYLSGALQFNIIDVIPFHSWKNEQHTQYTAWNLLGKDYKLWNFEYAVKRYQIHI